MNKKTIIILGTLLLFLPFVSAFDFNKISFTSDEDEIFLEVSLREIFSKDAFDSLRNGQEIKIYLDVTVSEKRNLMVNKKVQVSKEKNIIQYNIITEKYHVVVGKKTTNRFESFEDDLKTAVNYVSSFKKLSILKKALIDEDKEYIININARVVSLKMSPPISFIFDLFFDLNYSISRSYNYTGSELLAKYFK